LLHLKGLRSKPLLSLRRPVETQPHEAGPMRSKLQISLRRSFNFNPGRGVKLKDIQSESSSFDFMRPPSRG